MPPILTYSVRHDLRFVYTNTRIVKRSKLSICQLRPDNIAIAKYQGESYPHPVIYILYRPIIDDKIPSIIEWLLTRRNCTYDYLTIPVILDFALHASHISAVRYIMNNYDAELIKTSRCFNDLNMLMILIDRLNDYDLGNKILSLYSFDDIPKYINFDKKKINSSTLQLCSEYNILHNLDNYSKRVIDRMLSPSPILNDELMQYIDSMNDEGSDYFDISAHNNIVTYSMSITNLTYNYKGRQISLVGDNVTHQFINYLIQKSDQDALNNIKIYNTTRGIKYKFIIAHMLNPDNIDYGTQFDINPTNYQYMVGLCDILKYPIHKIQKIIATYPNIFEYIDLNSIIKILLAISYNNNSYKQIGLFNALLWLHKYKINDMQTIFTNTTLITRVTDIATIYQNVIRYISIKNETI